MFKKILTAAVLMGVMAVPASAGAYVTPKGKEVCPGQTFEQAFLQFGDKRHYTAVPGGDFESGLEGWDVSEGVEIQGHENPFRPVLGASALFMPAGSTVTSAPVCVSKGYPVARIFQQKLSGKGGASLKVEVLYPPRAKGKGRVVKPAGRLKGSEVFTASRKFAIGQGRIGRGTTNVRFRFTVIGEGSYLVDDVMVDPRCRR